MKSPDEIKKGLECCRNLWDCKNKDCPYLGDGCYPKLHEDIKTRMEQLEFQNGELLKMVEMLKAEIEEYEESADKCCYESQCNAELNKLEALCKRLRDENEQLEAERDALVADIRMEGGLCSICKYADNMAHSESCRDCNVLVLSDHSNWEWRGVQKEE